MLTGRRSYWKPIHTSHASCCQYLPSPKIYVPIKQGMTLSFRARKKVNPKRVNLNSPIVTCPLKADFAGDYRRPVQLNWRFCFGCDVNVDGSGCAPIKSRKSSKNNKISPKEKSTRKRKHASGIMLLKISNKNRVTNKQTKNKKIK